MPQFMKNVLTAIREQIVSFVTATVFGIIFLWLHLSQDKVRNAVMSFLADPKNFPYDLFVLAVIALIPFSLEFLRMFSRGTTIKRGADIIFEDKDILYVANVVDVWTASAKNDALFRKEDNHLRIKNAYVNGKIKLGETSQSNSNPQDPVSYMTIEKVEFIRWYENNAAIQVPKTWKLSSKNN